MGKSKAKSPRKEGVRRTRTHGKGEANGRINARLESGRQERTWPNVSVDDDDDAH